jgi:glycosyltransferase involved in cell wall biosynthesis
MRVAREPVPALPRKRASAVRLLVVHRGLLRGRDEGLDVRELIAGLLEGVATAPDLEVYATDCRHLYRPRLRDGQIAYERASSLRQGLRAGFDVVHVHMPWVAHLRLALHQRLRGAAVLCSPMSMLGDDFARASWFRPTRRGYVRLKPLFVRLARVCWRIVSTQFVVLSADEVRLAHLPARRCVLVPWTVPPTPLAEAAARWLATTPAAPVTPASRRPIAFVSRFDGYRKGFDRLYAWLLANEARLPRPAVVLLAPDDREQPPELAALVERNLIEWDPTTRGEGLLPRLRECRGLVLLSRWDGQPRILREAALLGLPTLSTASSHFSEVVELLGKGAVVDGDDVDAIQKAFERMAAADAADENDHRRAWRLFDRRTVGRYLRDVVVAAAGRGTLPERSYYRWVTREGGLAEREASRSA